MIENNNDELELLKEENKRLKKICERYKLVIEGSNDGIWEWDTEKDIYKLSLKDKKSFDYEESIDDVSINVWKKTLHPEDLGRAKINLDDFLTGKIDYYENVYRMQNKEGLYKWVLSKGKGIKNNQGKISYVAGSHTDITEKIEMEKQLYLLAYTDKLTKLSNREKLSKDFKKIIKRDLKNKKIVFFYIDIDEFGYINNTLGYEEGNKLIKKTAEFLHARYGKDHYLARVSSDEFLVIYEAEDNIQSIEKELNSLILEIKKGKLFEKHEIIITISIGAAIYENHGKEFFELIRKADTALYCAKMNGKDQFKIYTPQMADKVYSTNDLINQIRVGMDKKEFEMHYQPIFHTKSNNLAGFEVLIRWNHPFRGLVPPLDFIPIAEVSGQMKSLEKMIFTEVFAQVEKWMEAGEITFFVAINLSAKGLLENDILGFLKELLLKYKIKPEKIEFEVTETAMIHNLSNSLKVLTEIRDLGFKISLDDFGKGYSSLSYLKRLPIDKVKLDRDFIEDIENPRDQFLIRSIIDLSQNLNLEVVAEGVEKQEELALLIGMNCDYIQGFLLGKPSSVFNTDKWLEEIYKNK